LRYVLIAYFDDKESLEDFSKWLKQKNAELREKLGADRTTILVLPE